MSAGTLGRPRRRRLFHVHHSRKPCRCQAMTVSGFTITSLVRHPAQTRANRTQSQRSVFYSRTRRGRVRCSTLNWCRKARISRWSAARDRAKVRRVSRSGRSTEIMADKGIHCGPQLQLPQRERPFWQAHPIHDRANDSLIDERAISVTRRGPSRTVTASGSRSASASGRRQRV